VPGGHGEECMEAREVRETFLKRRTREVRRMKEMFSKTFSIELLSSLVLRFSVSP
jgi:hypothetical protein